MKTLTLLFRALADESRLRILHLLFKSGELCVCDIESTIDATQTKVSRHLRYLKRAGLVQDRRQGLWILYSIARPATPEHRRMLTIVRSILMGNELAIRDGQKLQKDIRNGCCATFSEIKPQRTPVLLRVP